MILLLALAAANAPEIPFQTVEVLPSSAACENKLVSLAREAEGQEAVRGPYEIEDGDIRIHMVRADGDGHLIVEYRCRGDELSTRSWQHSMRRDTVEEPVTVESWSKGAPWLKKDAPEQ